MKECDMILEELKDILWKKENGNIWQYDLDKLIDYIEILSRECTGKLELNKKMGVYTGFLDMLIKKYDLKLDLQYKLGITNPNFKAIYQDYDWCYQKYVIEGMNHEQMAIEANCSKRVVEKWTQERHKLTQKYRQIHKQLNKLQSDLLIGCMLGDGHIDKRETQPIFIISHAENQKDYLYWKYDILKDLCNISPSEIQGGIRYFSNNTKGYLCQKQYRLCTRIYDCLKEYRSASYGELLKKLNDFSFCIWMLDDGYRGDSNWQLCIAEYTQEEIDYAIKIFKDKWEIKAWSAKDIRYLMFDAISSRKIDKMMLDIIPNNLDIIHYKIIDNCEIKSKQKYIMLKIDNEDIKLVDYCRKNKLDYRRIINRTYKQGIDIYNSIRKEMNI